MIGMVRYDGLLDSSLSRVVSDSVTHQIKLMIGMVRYDGLLDSSLSRDCRRLTHPTFY